MAKNLIYPLWKVVVWRFARTFLATFLTTLGTQLVILKVEDLNKATLLALAIASGSAALTAAGKALRESDLPEDLTKLLPL